MISCHHHNYHHHIRFYVHLTCWHALDGFQKIDFQAYLSLARSLLTLLSLKSIFITSSHVFFGLPLPTEPDTSTALHLLTQKLLFILSMWPNQRSLICQLKLIYNHVFDIWYQNGFISGPSPESHSINTYFIFRDVLNKSLKVF